MPRGDAPSPAAGQPPSRQSSVTELELAFAQDPSSDAFLALCEAYLAQQRFMEAMVVCKKGIKQHPDLLDGHLMMLRVYEAQGKLPRAQQLLADLTDRFSDAPALALAEGRIAEAAGEQERAVAAYQRAVADEQTREEAAAALGRLGAPVAAAPAPVPAPAERAPSADARADSVAASGPATTVATAAAVPAALVPEPWQPPAEQSQVLDQLAEAVAAERPPRGNARTVLRTAAVLLVASIVFVGYRVYQKNRVEAIDALLTEAMPAFRQDMYASYRRAASAFEEILSEHDGDHPLTLGLLAHTYAILAHEHADSDARTRLKPALARAQADAPEVSHTVAAVALDALYSGGGGPVAARQAAPPVRALLDRVAEKEGAAPYADLTMGIIQVEAGQYEAARTSLARASGLEPSSVRAKVWHGRAAVRGGHFDVARGVFRGALSLSREHPGARTGLVLAFIAKGQLPAAANELVKFDEFSRKNSKEISVRDQARAEFARSAIARASADEPLAKAYYERAVELDPKNPDFPYGLGEWLIDQQRGREALPHLQKAVAMDPNRPLFLVALAEAQMRSRKWSEAKKSIDQAFALAPEQYEVLFAKARWLRRRKKRDAEDFIKGLIERYEAPARLELGRLHRAKGDLEAATEQLEGAIKKMQRYPKAFQGEILLSYGKLMLDRKDETVALNAFRRAAKFGAVEAWYRMALMLRDARGAGRTEAKQACQQYLGAGRSLRYSSHAERICASM